MIGQRSFALAAVMLVCLSIGTQADTSGEKAAFDAISDYVGKAANIDIEPIFDVLKDEIHHFVEMRSDNQSTHKLVHHLIGQVMDGEDEHTKKQEEDYQSFEAFTGMLDVVGVPQKPKDGVPKRAMAAAGAAGGAMIPPGTFIAGSPFIGLNDNPSLTPFAYANNPNDYRTLPAQLQNKFNDFYAECCVQAGLSAHSGQYNFPGFDLGSIEIEVSKGGCFIDKHSSQLLCDSGFISYTKTPASLNGFSKSPTMYQGSYCPPLTFPKKGTSTSKSVGGVDHTVWKK